MEITICGGKMTEWKTLLGENWSLGIRRKNRMIAIGNGSCRTSEDTGREVAIASDGRVGGGRGERERESHFAGGAEGLAADANLRKRFSRDQRTELHILITLTRSNLDKIALFRFLRRSLNYSRPLRMDPSPADRFEDVHRETRPWPEGNRGKLFRSVRKAQSDA